MSKEKIINLSNNNLSESQSATLAKNLEFLLILRGVDTKELSSNTNISITNINNIKRGIANPTLETLVTLANFFNVSVSHLIEKNLLDGKTSLEYSLITIPLLELDALDIFLKNKWHGGEIAISVLNHLSQLRRIAIKLNNNSFSPIYEKDTLFIVNLEMTCQDGDIVIVKIGESPSMIRKILFTSEKVTLYYPTLLDTQPVIENKKNVKILGIVEKIIKER